MVQLDASPRGPINDFDALLTREVLEILSCTRCTKER